MGSGSGSGRRAAGAMLTAAAGWQYGSAAIKHVRVLRPDRRDRHRPREHARLGGLAAGLRVCRMKHNSWQFPA